MKQAATNATLPAPQACAAALNYAMLDCLARAMQGGASIEGRALNLSQANKCARSFAVQPPANHVTDGG